MADKTWSSEEDTVEKADRNSYPAGAGDDAGGISNRPLDEERENQDALPERGIEQARRAEPEQRGCGAMTGNPGRRRTNPSDPTAERTSDPVPVGDDVIDRDKAGEGRDEEDVDDPVIPAETP